uniref:non-specific serine/threonine protein kinase n=1 Tax=Zea mays TaxID=4577 RepID=A0A804MSN9_MAIZE
MATAAPGPGSRSRLLPLALSSFLLLLLLLLIAPGAAAQPWQSCGNTDNYSANSTYQSNLASLAKALPANASRSATLFAEGSAGALPDAVYALALCRGDINATACGACVTTAFQDAQQLCAYNKDAAVFYDACYLRFSNKDFIASATNNGDAIVLMNSQNVSPPVRAFDAAVAVLLNATADYAAANSSRRFATGEEGFDATDPTIYGLTQCTPNMSPAECRTCLRSIISDMPQYLSGRRGGRIIGMRCNFRYDLYSFFSGGPSLRLPAPSAPAPAPSPAQVNVTPTVTPTGRSRNRTGIVIAIVLPIVAGVLAITMVCLCFLWRRRPARDQTSSYSVNQSEIESIDSLLLDISMLRAATDNFAESNRLGEGGFGTVYKGVLPDNQEIAVKRLSQSSGQGIQELKNELVLVAKLQHKNLVRLVGVCLQEYEKLLVYEYMPNKSIDTILFDSEKSKELDWGKRVKIIDGIARGLQYLHEDSQLKIIHRDLKASNVLLNSDYTPKISDFGLARLFGGDQSREVTNRVVGTYGYMSPEYAMRGHYSIKSDVFSFGVLILEILTGRSSSGSFNIEQSVDLLSLVRHYTIPKPTKVFASEMITKFAFDTGLGALDNGNNCGDHGSISERQSSCRTDAEKCPYRATVCSR